MGVRLRNNWEATGLFDLTECCFVDSSIMLRFKIDLTGDFVCFTGVVVLDLTMGSLNITARLAVNDDIEKIPLLGVVGRD